MNSIEIKGLTKTFKGKKRSSVEALKNLDLSVQQGEVFGFLGPNGAGKSTTIKILMGLISPTSGDAHIMGTEISSREARRHVGYLPENPAFYDYLSAEEYLTFVGRTFSLSASLLREKREEVLRLLDLWDVRKRPLRGYSKGMVQRVGLAQVLIHDPDVYILDEPMSGLDPIGRALVKDIILDLKKQGKTVFFSTHVTADAERVCDRIGVIVDGLFQEERVVGDLLREGVDGYFCRVRGLASEAMHDYDVVTRVEDVCELFVPRDRYNAFAADLLKNGGSFDLVEPRRRDIESYFLELVRTSGESRCA
jgi:ABC-2 type transport system ATP-binding protein